MNIRHKPNMRKRRLPTLSAIARTDVTVPPGSTTTRDVALHRQAVVLLGIAGMFYGEDAGDRLIGSLVAITGVVQILYGGYRRRGEHDDRPDWDRRSRRTRWGRR